MTYICLKTKSKQVDFQSFNQFELQKEPHLWERVPSPNVLVWPVWWYTGDSGTQEAVAAPAWWLSRLKKKKNLLTWVSTWDSQWEGGLLISIRLLVSTPDVFVHTHQSHTIKHFFKHTGEKVERSQPVLQRESLSQATNKAQCGCPFVKMASVKTTKSVWLTRNWQGVVSQKAALRWRDFSEWEMERNGKNEVPFFQKAWEKTGNAPLNYRSGTFQRCEVITIWQPTELPCFMGLCAWVCLLLHLFIYLAGVCHGKG